MNFLGGTINILGLILLAIVVLSLVIPYKEAIEETQTPKNLEQQAELAQQNDESNQFIGDVINAEAGKRMPDIQNGLDEDSKFIDVKVSEDDIPKIVEVKNTDELSKTELDKAIEQCKVINENRNCNLLLGTACGFCLDTGMIVAGNKDGPVEINACSKKGWVAPGPDAGRECIKMKERYVCSQMKDCGDTAGKKSYIKTSLLTATGMVYKQQMVDYFQNMMMINVIGNIKV